VTIFDLLFILIFLSTVVAVATAIFQAIRGHWRKSLRVLSVSAVSLAVYFAICCATTLLTPRRVLGINEPQCFDDWCVALENVIEMRDGPNVKHAITVRIFSEAKRATQRENGIAFYMEDDRGHRYPVLSTPSDTPTNVLLQPGESVTLSRGYEIPPGTHLAGFVVTHEGGFPIGWFIIGEGQSLFHKEPITHLQ
jgi:hypothetical protein